MIFINTRPASRAKNLTQFLQNQSIKVLDLPLLELVPKPLAVTDVRALENIDQCKAIILVSEEAVTYGLAALANSFDLSNLSQLPIAWLAVGEKTADCFSHIWQTLTTSSPPSVIFPNQKQQQNNEGLLLLPQIHSLKQGDSIQLWRGVGGREWLANALLKNGIDVQLINFYQRILPQTTIKLFTNLLTNFYQQQIVLISSLAAWQHWLGLCDKFAVDSQSFYYLVLQARLFGQLSQHIAPAQLIQVNDLSPHTIATALASFAFS